LSVFKESTSYRPFIYPWAVEMSKKHAIEMFWDVHQIELQDDLRQYNSKDGLKTKDVSHETNKYIIDQLLCVFTEMDKTVAGGYTQLLPYIKNNEARTWFLTVAQRETVHQRGYAILAETFGFTDKDWSRFSEYAEMRDKLDAMTAPRNLIGRDEYKAAAILATILLGEGIGLFGAFAVLLNFKRQGKLMGFNDVNQWSLLDEQEHVTGNIKFLNEMRKDLTEAENWAIDDLIIKVVKNYEQAEHRFLDLLYAIGSQQDLDIGDVKKYITYLGQLRLFQLGLISLEEVPTNPLEWMDWMLSASRHDAFFEKRVTDYSHKRLEGGVDYSKYRE
jgi:ribonucleotide reductase beta subunit family protein with ferritin-like domain